MSASTIFGSPTHRCNLCGAGWFLWPDGKSWVCLAPEPGQCCADDKAGPSVQPLTDEPVTVYLKSEPYHESR